MVLDAFFRRASETFPIPVMLRALLERVFEPARLNDWFEAVTEKQYTRELLFSSAFELMSVVVFKAFGSVHAAYQAKRTAGEITVSVTSVYNKLNGVEAQTSRALVRDTAGHLRHLVEDVQGGCRPWLPGYRVKVLDGNCIAATEHRLQVLRTTAAGPLPGKALVVYDPAVEMAIDVFPCEDGHAQERALLGEVVPTVQAGDLWIMDRNFCVRAFLAGIEARAGTFLCRYHKGLPVTALAPARFVGSIETGKVYEQQVEVLMAPRPGEDADDVRIYDIPLSLTTGFYSDTTRGERWRTYLAKRGRLRAPLDFGTVGELVKLFLTPPWRALSRGDRFATAWPPGGPWQPATQERSGDDV